ncbi:MAG: hypothetical protein STSR0008_09870 [Ignavibacterium sp.]
MNEVLTKDKSEQIIEAARKRFAVYGFLKVTMDEIALDMEMGKASLYYYFPTKENLFEEVIKKEQNEFIKEIECLLNKNISSSEKLRHYVIERLDYFQELINLGMLGVNSMFEVKSLFKKLFHDFEINEIQLLKKIIDEGISTGEFKEKLSDETPDIILYILQGLRLRTIRDIKLQKLDSKSLKHLKNEMLIVIDLIINGIKK